MPDKYKFINGQWYEVDDQGNIIYSDQYSDVPGTLTREIETGNMVDDPNQKRVYYTIQGYSDDAKGKVNRENRRERRKYMDYIMGNKDVLTSYEKKYNNGEHITKKDLKDEEFLKALANNQFDTEREAGTVRKVAYPTLSEKTRRGHFVKEDDKFYIPYLDITLGNDSWCPGCESGIGLDINRKYFDGLKWIDPSYNHTNASINENVEYGQMPEMKTQYATPIQTKVEEVTETRPMLIPRTTVTPNSSIEVITTPRRTNRPTTRSTPVNSKPIKTYIPRENTTTTTNVDTVQSRTNSRIVFPDGSYGDWTYGEWVEQ